VRHDFVFSGVIMLELNAKTTALVVIDLQEGILPFAGGPHTADEVVNRAGKLAAKFRASGQPVFLVRVGWSADYAEALKQPVDAPSPCCAGDQVAALAVCHN
jgi:nicotinamidase-related amidase